MSLLERAGIDRSLDVAVDPVAAVVAFCEQGRAALVQASTLEEGKHVLGALSTLEHAVKVRDLNADAVTAASAMRVRAERRVGELIRQEREAGRLAKPEDGPRLRAVRSDPLGQPEGMPETLADHGISYDQAAEFTRLADADEDTFERAVTDVTRDATRKPDGRQRHAAVTRSEVLRRIDPEREKSRETRWIEADKFVETCKRLAKQSDAAVTAIRFGLYPGDLPLVPQAV